MDRVKITNSQFDSMANLFGYKGLPNRWKILDRVFDIKIGDTILDCGAFQSDMSLYFSRKVGKSGKVYSIEAHPDNVKILLENIKRFRLRNVQVIDKGLSSKVGTTKLYKSNYNNACSILSEFRKVDNTQYIDINITTIDNLNLDRVDFIWMNIEGAELKAIKGAKDTLSDNNCKILISTHKITDDYYNTEDVMKLLETYNYKPSTLKDRYTWVYAEK